MPYFGVCQHRNPWVDLKKNYTIDYVVDPTPRASIGVYRFKGGVCACVKLSPSGVFFKGSYASLQVGPLDPSSPLTAQMTRPRGVHVPFMVLLIKKYFPYFSPKNVKNCITPYGKWER